MPIRKEEYAVEINGKAFDVKDAYNGVYPTVSRSHPGMFAGISSLEPDVEHTIMVKLTAGLKPGQFQGLFIEHVEDEYTMNLAAAPNN